MIRPWVAVLALAACRLFAADEPPLIDIPSVSGISIDGDIHDWGEQGFAARAFIDLNGRVRSADDFDASVRLGWNSQGLLLAARVKDNAVIDRDEQGAQKDELVVMIAVAPNGCDGYTVSLRPDQDAEHPQPPYAMYEDLRIDAKNFYGKLNVAVARQAIAGGYAIEALFGWDDLGIKPAAGSAFDLSLVFHDFDGQPPATRASWAPLIPTRGQRRLRLAEKPSPALHRLQFLEHDAFRRLRLGLVAEKELAAKKVEIKEGDRVLASGTFEVNGTKSRANTTLPMPAFGALPSPLTITADGAPFATITPQNWTALRREAFTGATLTAKTGFVFGNIDFPVIEFDAPNLIEDLVGPYTVTTTFYDSAYNPVTSAKKPGRYGAVIEVHPEKGDVLRRYVTLFKTASYLNWRMPVVAATVKLPAEVGITPALQKEQPEVLREYMSDRLVESLTRDQRSAVLMAGLFETELGGGPVKDRRNPGSLDQAWWYGLKKKRNEIQFRYLAHTPPEYNADPASRWPLILYLHGSGERGFELEKVKEHGPLKMAEQGKKIPAVIVTPQCNPNDRWSSLELAAMLDEILAKYRIDPDRIYLTGNSMGGMGAWILASDFPERFAAVAPLCGRSDPADAERVAGLPFWVVHGGKDGSVPARESNDLVQALKTMGSDVHYSFYPQAKHDIWSHTYASDAFYEWLFAQRRKKR